MDYMTSDHYGATFQVRISENIVVCVEEKNWYFPDAGETFKTVSHLCMVP